MSKKSGSIAIAILACVFVISYLAQPAFAQFQQGGVNHPGVWWVGENLEQGDYFSYKVCHHQYKGCTEFEMDFWFEGKKVIDGETKWIVKTVVYDGTKKVFGKMYLGEKIPEPSGGSKELAPYTSVFKSSIVWMSAYASAEIEGLQGKGPKKFSDPSWGKIANIGGEQIIPTKIEGISIPAGDFETVLVTWKTGGQISKVWVLDDFPFPIKANTWVHTNTGVSPQEYRFELLDFKKDSPDPFSDFEEKDLVISEGCDSEKTFTKTVQNTNTFSMVVEVTYKPENPVSGCEIEWFINFKRMSYPAEFENNVQYDIMLLDEKTSQLYSIAEKEGKRNFFSASGQVHRLTEINEAEGISKYAIVVHGTNPEFVVADPEKYGWITLEIPISKNSDQKESIVIPSWIKQNASWWCQDTISDDDFSSGIEFMIKTGLMSISSVASKESTQAEIPQWIKNNACWWSDGIIDDEQFGNGIQFLILQGIISV